MQKSNLEKSIERMTGEIAYILSEIKPSIYLYGSVAIGDFKLGWSDIDILVLTEKQITDNQANKLVDLRQILSETEGENLYYHLFEGGMLTLEAFLSGARDRVVYWGTSGQRITDNYHFNNFSKVELIENGLLLYGKEIRSQLKKPTYNELYQDVKAHYETIRKYGTRTDGSVYSYGWMLDICRCLYTLRTGKIIGKTEAGRWGLEESLCPQAEVLQKALTVRESPLDNQDMETVAYAERLFEPIQRYADVLEKEIMSIIIS